MVVPPEGRTTAGVVLERRSVLVGTWLPEVVVAMLVEGPVAGGDEEGTTLAWPENEGGMAIVERVVGIEDDEDAAVDEKAAIPKPTDEVLEVEAKAGLNWYMSSLLLAPQYSVELPAQSMLQSVAGAGTAPAENEFPQ